MPATRPSRGNPSPAAMRLVLAGPSAALHRTGAAPMAVDAFRRRAAGAARARRLHVTPALAAVVVARPGAGGRAQRVAATVVPLAPHGRCRRGAGHGAVGARRCGVARSRRCRRAANCSAATTIPIARSWTSGSTRSATCCVQRHARATRAHRRVRARRPSCRRRGTGRTIGHRRSARRGGAAPVDEAALPRRPRSAALAAFDRFATHSPPNSRAPSRHARRPSCCR